MGRGGHFRGGFVEIRAVTCLGTGQDKSWMDEIARMKRHMGHARKISARNPEYDSKSADITAQSETLREPTLHDGAQTKHSSSPLARRAEGR